MLVTSSGTTALILAIKALALTGEIITSPFIFPAVPHAISFCGLTPVFCDIDPTNFNIDPDKIARLITNKTSAILAVHTFGHPCDIAKITALAKKYKLKVIYDAAPAFNVYYKNKNIVSYGDASIHSYHATKIFHTIEGGAVFFRNAHDLLRAKELREFGFDQKKERIKAIGINAKMSEFHAAMGLATLPLVEKEIKKRSVVWNYYSQALSGIKKIQLPVMTQNLQTYSILIPTYEKNTRAMPYKNIS